MAEIPFDAKTLESPAGMAEVFQTALFGDVAVVGPDGRATLIVLRGREYRRLQEKADVAADRPRFTPREKALIMAALSGGVGFWVLIAVWIIRLFIAV
jgi:hypothetical protein